MKIKTKDLTGAALDWAVAISKGIPAEELYIQKWGSRMPPSIYRRCRDADGSLGPDLLFSRKWEAGGPIIDREGISIYRMTSDWSAAYNPSGAAQDGPTPLIAAMRCYVASKLGDEVDVPEKLI